MTDLDLLAKLAAKLGLPEDTAPAELTSAVADLKRVAVRRRLCAKLRLPRDVDDATLHDAIVAAIRNPTPARPAPQPVTGSYPRVGGRDGLPFARNPLLEQMRANGALPGRGQRTGRGQPPTLFETGDLPRFTASGNDPQMLLHLPACVRHAAAKADQAEWARLFNSYATGGPEDDLGALLDPAAQDVGNLDYESRFRAWRRGEAG